MIRSIYHFHVYYHIRRILKVLEIPLPYDNSFNQHNNPYNHEKFIKNCGEYKFINDLNKWRNKKSFLMWQSRAWETGNLACHILMKIRSPDGLLRNRMA